MSLYYLPYLNAFLGIIVLPVNLTVFILYNMHLKLMHRLHEKRPLHLHAVELGNLADSYRCFIRIVSIDCQSKRRDMCTAAQRGCSDMVVS